MYFWANSPKIKCCDRSPSEKQKKEEAMIGEYIAMGHISILMTFSPQIT